MASITITIPDAVAPRVLDAMAMRYGWTAESGLTKAQFAKSVLVRLLRETVKMYEGQAATDVAIEISNQKVDTEIVIN